MAVRDGAGRAGAGRADSLLLREVRLVPVAIPAPTAEPVDLRLSHGVVTDVAPALQRRPGERVLEAAGRWAMPGLWDAHVHLGQWARNRQRLDVSGSISPDDVTRRVAEHVRALPTAALAEATDKAVGVVLGYGYRSAGWARQPTVAELDAVCRGRPVVLISGDAHNGWLSSAALRLLGVPLRSDPLVEHEWFAVLARLDRLSQTEDAAAAYRAAAGEAAARGVVGVVDFEFGAGPHDWQRGPGAGLDLLRVRAACYPDSLEPVVAAGWRTGDGVSDDRLVTVGPLKVIFDGSVNTATAYCCDPYGSPGGGPTTGRLNLSPHELTELLRRAAGAGLHVAVHAIGDAAVRHALDAIAAAGAKGSVEHAQLVARRDVPRFAELGVTASVQPAHLLDDRDVTAQLWPDRADRCFPLRSLLDSGARLALGSDAPVAPLDPWLAVAAAVHRSADERPPWNRAESLTVAEALAASTDGQLTLAPGSRADVVLLDDDPLAELGRGTQGHATASAHTAAGDTACGDSAGTAQRLRGLHVAATLLAGRPTHLDAALQP